MQFGVLLNLGAILGDTTEEVFDLTLTEAELAEQLGYDELWVTEHHFIRFGINPSALTTAAFLLGRSHRIRVGTSVVLSPLCHPVELAERAALLDQLSGGRFALGLGRGGYRRDYERLDVEFARWDDEPQSSAQQLVDIWTSPRTPDLDIQPAPLSDPHPPVLLATTSDAGVQCAARNGLALQHYFATPAAARVAVEERYAGWRDDPTEGPHHLHTLITLVTEDPTARDRLKAALRRSFHDGAHPHVPQSSDRHLGPDGTPFDPDQMADMVGDNAIIGSPAQVVDELGSFIAATNANRITIYHEAIADRETTLRSLEDFAQLVIPQLVGSAVPQR